jgi:uncharacterized membrane protein YkvA (DUF1232 family)
MLTFYSQPLNSVAAVYLLITQESGAEKINSMVSRQKIKPWMLKKELLVLYYGIQDKRTGIWSKLIVLISVIYLVSPLDLIPDFIPFFGWLDDLVLVPLLLNLAIRWLPDQVREEGLVKASRIMKKFRLLITVFIVLFVALVVFLLVKPLFNRS